MSVRVYDLAHARAGDKGNTSNISVIAYSDEAWQVLRRELTPERVLAHFRHLTAGPVRRYELPQLHALNFVIENALGGGVTRSLAIDPHGKSLSALMLTITLPGHNERAADFLNRACKARARNSRRRPRARAPRIDCSSCDQVSRSSRHPRESGDPVAAWVPAFGG